MKPSYYYGVAANDTRVRMVIQECGALRYSTRDVCSLATMDRRLADCCDAATDLANGTSMWLSTPKHCEVFATAESAWGILASMPVEDFMREHMAGRSVASLRLPSPLPKGASICIALGSETLVKRVLDSAGYRPMHEILA